MQEKQKTTAQVLVDCLEAEGVDVMFGIPGEETLDLMFAIRDSHIRFIPVRHEQGAAFFVLGGKENEGNENDCAGAGGLSGS